MYENETLFLSNNKEIFKKHPKSYWWCIFDVYKNTWN